MFASGYVRAVRLATTKPLGIWPPGLSLFYSTFVMCDWHPLYNDLWMGPKGIVYQIDPTGSVRAFSSHVLVAVRKSLWQQPSQHYLGKGLESEPADASFAIARSLRAAGMLEQA